MKIIGIDPGGTTGWATWSTTAGFSDFGQLEDVQHHSGLYELLTEKQPDVIVCESFEDHKANMGSLLVSIEYIGVVKAWASIWRVRLVTQQSTIKNWATNAKLEAAGIQHRNWRAVRNAADAQRHILYFLAHNPYVNGELRNATLRLLRT
jgi:hypothetical protein